MHPAVQSPRLPDLVKNLSMIEGADLKSSQQYQRSWQTKIWKKNKQNKPDGEEES